MIALWEDNAKGLGIVYFSNRNQVMKKTKVYWNS